MSEVEVRGVSRTGAGCFATGTGPAVATATAAAVYPDATNAGVVAFALNYSDTLDYRTNGYVRQHTAYRGSPVDNSFAVCRTRYLRCQTKHCRATARIIGRGEISLIHAHSAICFSDKLCQLKADFRHALKSALRRNYWKLKDLYETISLLYPPEIKVEIPYNSIKNSLKEWRKSMYPRNPTDLEEMAAQLTRPENSKFTEYDVGRLVCKRITDSDEKTHLLLYDPEFVELAFRNVTRIFIDATFQTTPKLRDVYQLLTVLGVTYDHALPFAHVLMSKKTQTAYTAVLTEISKLLINSNVKLIMTDFEQALRNASKSVFSSAHVTGCNVHYDRALLKQVKKLKLDALVKNDEAAKLFVRKIMALAFLPENMVFIEYQTLINELSPTLKRAFRGFIQYYERQWLIIVKPLGFCVHGLSRRTNNVSESYNSVLADEMGKHPNPWTFLGKLVKLTSKARDDFQSLRRSKKIKRHPRYSSVYKQTELVAAWRQLHRGDISSYEFLDKAAMLKGRIRQRLAIIENDRSENDVELTETPQNIPAAEDPDYDREVFDGLRIDEDQNDVVETLRPNNHETQSDQNQFSDSDHASLESEDDESESEQAEYSSVDSSASQDVEEESIDDDVAQVIGPEETTTTTTTTNNENDEIRGDAEQGIERGLEEDIWVLSSDDENITALVQVVPDAQNVNVDHGNLVHQIDVADPINVVNDSINNENDEIRGSVAQGVDRGWEEDIQVISSGEEGTIGDVNDDRNSDVVEVVEERNNENNSIPPVAEASTAAGNQSSSGTVSRSRKKNLRKKRNRQLKAANGNMPHRPRGHKRRSKKVQKAPTCVVCLMLPITHLFVPCGHHCCCERCAGILMSAGNKTCPKCRAPVQLVNRVFKEP